MFLRYRILLIHSGLYWITNESVPTQELSLYVLKEHRNNVLSFSVPHLSEREIHDLQYNANPTFII